MRGRGAKKAFPGVTPRAPLEARGEAVLPGLKRFETTGIKGRLGGRAHPPRGITLFLPQTRAGVAAIDA